MKKAIFQILFISILFLGYYMTTHRPSEEQFYTWLEEKYQIDCKEKVTCTRKADENSVYTLIETGSNIKSEYLIFNTVGKIYEDQHGDRTTIKAIGVFDHFYTIIKDESSPHS
ncbi:hypothetical protein [Bacillus sp. Marseille-Q1617]|uniref:hypothetical protein n=1 Tax=Bacillus sp. Marseille-Q1617 TaxID=2736887 RepID=UPI00158E9C5E|nr:hypothetical protein [Bacillus sp. Marseille-Q1617]